MLVDLWLTGFCLGSLDCCSAHQYIPEDPTLTNWFREKKKKGMQPVAQGQDSKQARANKQPPTNGVVPDFVRVGWLLLLSANDPDPFSHLAIYI